MTLQFVQRHPENPNLHCMQAAYFQGLPIYPEQGPFILEYLQRGYETVERALEQYPETYSLCFRLCYPAAIAEVIDGNGALSEFWRLLNARVQADAQALQIQGRALRYLWSRVETENEPPHYRCCLLLPRGLYRSVGAFHPAELNLHHHLCSAWASALGLELHLASGLVKTARKSQFYISRERGIEELWRLVSQLGSIHGKSFGNRSHWFDSSRG